MLAVSKYLHSERSKKRIHAFGLHQIDINITAIGFLKYTKSIKFGLVAFIYMLEYIYYA
jgi:hypothetical protein